MLRAIGCMFSKHSKYPKNPLLQQEEYVVVEDMDLTEEDKEKYTQMWFDRLQSMADKNYLSKGR